MNVCVLGATGFIGGQIARAAAARGWRVRAVRRSPGAVGAIGDVPVEWVQGDLFDRSSLQAAMQGCEVLFHAAASYPQNFRQIEREVERARTEMNHVLAAAEAAQVRRVIYTSSLTTLGPPRSAGELPDETTFYTPGSVRSAYYEAKHAMEQMALAAAASVDLAVLIPTAVFGPGDTKPTTSVVIRDAARGLFPVYFDAVLNAVDGRDVAAAHIAAVDRATRGERYVIGGANLELYALLAAVARCAGRKPPPIHLSRGLVAGLVRLADAIPWVSLPENFRTFEQWRAVSDAKARRELGHTSRPFEDTARDTIAWFRGK